MRKLGLFLAIIVSFGYSYKAHSQSPYKLELVFVGDDKVDVGLVPFGGRVVEKRDKFYLRLVRQKDVEMRGSYYLSLFDLQPNQEIKQIFLNKTDVNLISKDSPDTIIYKDIIVNWMSMRKVFRTPYGNETFLLLFSPMPVTLTNNAPVENLQKQITNEDIKWIQQGTPPAFLGQNHFSYQFNFSIIPQIKVSTGGSSPKKGTGAGSNKSNEEEMDGTAQQKKLNSYKKLLRDYEMRKALESGKKYKKPEIIYRMEVPNDEIYNTYPVLTLYEPAEPSYADAASRGVNLVANPVTYTSYVVKGSVSSMSEIAVVEVWVQPDSGKSASYYKITEFKKAPQSLFFEKQINLLPGNNLLEINVITKNGFGVKQQLELFCKQDKVITPGRDIVLAMAVNDYVHWPKLKNTVADAESVVTELANHYGFKSENIIRFYNENFTKRKVDSVFRKLISTLTENDRIIVYYAGHGYYDSLMDEGYWIPFDGASIDQDYSSYISNSTINKYIKSLKTSHTLFITDACFSGSYFVEQSRGADNFTSQMNRLRSRWLFTSGRMETVADDFQNSGHSPFATYLIKYLTQPSTPEFTISDLSNYVTKTVGNVSNQIPLARPIRNAGDEGGEFVFRYR